MAKNSFVAEVNFNGKIDIDLAHLECKFVQILSRTDGNIQFDKSVCAWVK